MLEERRKYDRFPLTLVAQRENEKGIASKITILELSVNGCFIEWINDAKIGDNFRLKIPLLRGDYLPIPCKIIYRLSGTGIGLKFLDVTRFEQDLIAGVIHFNMRKRGVYNVDPYTLTEVCFEAQINLR